MKSFQERNPLVIGVVGVTLVVGVMLLALHSSRLPFLNDAKSYTADFAEAGGLKVGSDVQVSGFPVGKVDSIALDGPRVLVKFHVGGNVRIGDRTEAAIKTKSLLGAKILEIIPRGEGTLSETIPLARTTSPYQLPDALGDLSTTISGLDTHQVSDSLAMLAETFKDTPPDFKAALAGVGRFSRTLDQRDAELRSLLANADKATGVLAQRSDQVVTLVADTNALLVALQTQRSSLAQISGNISAAFHQLKGLIAENRSTLKPALDKLNEVLAIVDKRKTQLQAAIKGLDHYLLSLGEAVSSGPFFKAYLANLLPGQFLQPFIDAAFSDLGLDPHVLLPSQLNDPDVGQPGTPPLPVPYPRTGQGGEPNRTLPDAITGKPGDPRYPYREPAPAPPPGGPPPGPPSPMPPNLQDPTPLTQSTSVELAPSQPPSAGHTPLPAGGGQR